MKKGKIRKAAESSIIHEASMNDINKEILDILRNRQGNQLLTDDEIFEHYRLASRRPNGRLLLSLAALMLFGKDPLQWNSGCWIDFVKWEGKTRKFGTQLNVVKRDRIEGSLPELIDKAFKTIKPHIRQRQQLVDLFFSERFEYPTFAWQEAIINAVAHRDYLLEGTPVEVWLFDDRMEIRSPGVFVEPVTLEQLQARERIHASRNPRIVRVLTDLGYMRELGEGMPRIFEVMEKEGLKPPELKLEAGAIFNVSLYNTPIYSQETLQWLKQFDKGLNRNQMRLLAYAYSHDKQFTSRQYQQLVGINVYQAFRDIQDLKRKGIAILKTSRGRVYEITSGKRKEWCPGPFIKIRDNLLKRGYVKNQDVQNILKVSRPQATRLLQGWASAGYLSLKGRGRGACYIFNEKNKSV